jgi:uncharacterized protein YggE
MKPSLLFALAIFAVLTAEIFAASAQPHPFDNRVTVTGSGEVRVTPDLAVITVDAAFTRITPRQAADEVRKTLNEVLRIARKAVRDSGDLRTARIGLNPEYDWTDGKRVFRGYTASQSLEITVRDLAKMEGLLEELFKTSINGVNGPDFRHSRADSLRREAGSLAMRDAAGNARNLCEAAMRSCEELIGARMTGSSIPGPFPMQEFKAMRTAADAGTAMPVQPGTLTFSAMVEADYRLK